MLDDALVLFTYAMDHRSNNVSILVMLDDALVQTYIPLANDATVGLNPCYAGRCSSTRETETILIINMLQNYTKVIFAFLNQKLTVS